jgi:hypothetical protein
MSKQHQFLAMAGQSANTQRAEMQADIRRPLAMALAVLWSVISLALLCWAMSRITIDRSGAADAAARNQHALWPYWLAAAGTWLGLTALWLTMPRAVESASRFTSRAALILLVAIAARVVVLVTHEPALSDDVYRYVFDGRNLARGINPYLSTPADRQAALHDGAAENWPGERALVKVLAFPEITTPYLPLSQYVFAALGWLCERLECTEPVSSARVFRSGFVALEALLMALLIVLIRRKAWSAWWLALYAWHPLPISEIAGSGHQDVIGIALMMFALAIVTAGAPGAAATRPHAHSRSHPHWRDVGWAGALAAAVLTKPVAGVAGLMALRRRSISAWMTCVLMGAIVWFILAMPLRWLPGQSPFAAWRTTADWMAEKAAHFGGVYEPVLCVVRHAMPDGSQRKPGFNLRQEWTARRVCVALLAAGLIVIWWRSRDVWRATALTMLLLTLCSTVCFPWYLMWGFALFAAGGAGGAAMWVYSLTIAWGYSVFITGKGHGLSMQWTVEPWVIAIAYIPVLAALILDLSLTCHSRPLISDP